MSDYIDFLKEVFAIFGPVYSRRMFGGYGLYLDGLMFGLVAQDVLYLKADAENRHFFEREGLEKFGYEKKGKLYYLSYFQAPDELYDDQEEAALWARRSWEAAVRGVAKKPIAKNKN